MLAGLVEHGMDPQVPNRLGVLAKFDQRNAQLSVDGKIERPSFHSKVGNAMAGTHLRYLFSSSPGDISKTKV